FIRSILAIQAADAIFLPIDASNPPARIDAILADSRSPFYLCCGEQSVTLEPFSSKNGSQELQPDAAYVMYTSGSTGTPKGAIVGHDSVSSLLEDVERKSALASDARCSWWTNVGFDVAIYEIFTALLHGRCLCIPSNETRLSPELFFAWLAQDKISAAYLPPFFADSFADYTTQHQNETLLRMLVGVEPIRESSLSRILQNCSELQILNGYGPTESTVCATIARISPSASSDAPAPIGNPVLGTKCKILSSNGAPAPQGVVGELFLGGTGQAFGYLHSAQLTREKFVRVPSGSSDDVYFQTGDLVRLRTDNQLEYVGRVDDQLKFNGVRIDPIEIQHAITSVQSVDACHVMLLESEKSRNRLVACFTIQDAGAAPSEEELRQACSEQLPRNMIPSQFVLLDTLPRTTNGKIDREQLSSLVRSEFASRNQEEHRLEATSETERQLQEIWCEVLKRDSIALDEDLFGLGGDSMSVIQIVTLAGQLGLQVKSSTVFQHSTIRRLAGQLEQQHVSVSPLLGEESSPQLTPIQRWFFQQPMANRDHWNHVVKIQLQEDVDQVALRTAIAEVFTRHEALQMRFLETEGEWTPIRRDQSEPGISITMIDASEKELHGRISIQDGQLWAASISEGSLILVAHHLAVDAVSWRILLQELVAQ
ncbi:MAG: AMP-binding protein, partial [Planctomycetota bacterium]